MAAAVFTLCKKDRHQVEKLDGEELKAKYAIIFPDLQYDSDEPATVAPNARAPKKAKASEVTFSVYPNSLPITITGSTMSSTAPAGTEWFGGQKFTDTTTNDGAKGLWGCGRYFTAPNPGTTPVSCQTEGPGFYRFFSSDFAKNVYLSKFEPQ